MNGTRFKEEEFKRIIEVYSGYMNFQVQRFNLLKYGLDPEDILQDIRIRIWKLLCNERPIQSPTSYIRRIINSAVIDQLRKRRRDDSLVLFEKRKRIAERSFSYSGESMQNRFFEQRVGKAVELLKDSRRQVIKLYLLNLNIKEISAYMNWSQDKTRNLLYRGFADLRKLINHQETRNEEQSS